MAPENTLAAIRKALELGGDGVEFDVHGTADGRPVLIHDHTVDRTTDGHGAVAELTLRQLQALDAGEWKSPAFAGEPIPVMEDALKLLAGRTMPVIEIKADSISNDVVAAIQAAGLTEAVTVISFSADALRAVKAACASIRTALLVGGEGLTAHHVMALTRKARADHPDMFWSLATRDCVRACHREGMPVWVWTVDDRHTMRRLIDRGVDGITTNDPALLKAELEA